MANYDLKEVTILQPPLAQFKFNIEDEERGYKITVARHGKLGYLPVMSAVNAGNCLSSSSARVMILQHWGSRAVMCLFSIEMHLVLILCEDTKQNYQECRI
jgi:hypothetical protein